MLTRILDLFRAPHVRPPVPDPAGSPPPTDLPPPELSAAEVPVSPAPPTMTHPRFGTMRWMSSGGLWIGETTGGQEFAVRGDFFDDDRLDAACEALALRVLDDLDGIQARIDEFLAASPIGRPAHLLGGRWDLEGLLFTNLDAQGIVHDVATCFLNYHLRGDDHNAWVVRVEDGIPVGLAGC